MTDTQEILDAVPTGVPLSTADVAAAIDACLRCVQTCTTCAHADLFEEEVAELRVCAALCTNCADVCDLTARILLGRRSGTSWSSTDCSRPASERARAAPRSARGTLTITVTAQSARRSAGRASKRAVMCSKTRRSNSSRGWSAPDPDFGGTPAYPASWGPQVAHLAATVLGKATGVSRRTRSIWIASELVFRSSPLVDALPCPVHPQPKHAQQASRWPPTRS